MKEEVHIQKYLSRRRAMLDHPSKEDVIESIMDDYRAGAGHLINAHAARFGLHEQNLNRIERFVRSHPEAFESPEELANVYNRLKDLRGAVVYGSREDVRDLERAEEILTKIKELIGIDPDSSE
ncbi:MAG: hypothetical protein QGG50_01775 [Methanopyri archaeon]|jgi:hypothetical protein|nr:hypothetical protein [Methanopyri archaeon]